MKNVEKILQNITQNYNFDFRNRLFENSFFSFKKVIILTSCILQLKITHSLYFYYTCLYSTDPIKAKSLEFFVSQFSKNFELKT